MAQNQITLPQQHRQHMTNQMTNVLPQQMCHQQRQRHQLCDKFDLNISIFTIHINLMIIITKNHIKIYLFLEN